MSTPVAPKAERETLGPRDPGEELCHLVEQHEPDRALCGKDVTGYPWNPPWPYCQVCLDLAEGLPHWHEFIRSLGRTPR